MTDKKLQELKAELAHLRAAWERVQFSASTKELTPEVGMEILRLATAQVRLISARVDALCLEGLN